MGIMSASPPAILEHKKQPFLKAFLKTGKVAPATRAVRISRDAVYDWLRADPSFRREFNRAKREKYDSKTSALSECLEFFLSIVKPILPANLYPRVVAATNLTLSTRHYNAGASPATRPASRKEVRLPSFDVHPETAISENGGSRDLHQGKNGTHS